MGYDEYLEKKFKALEDRLTALENKGKTYATESSGSTIEMLIDVNRKILKDPHTPDEFNGLYLGQIALMLGAIDDDLKALRQTISDMTEARIRND